jgi:hypothetical protein
MVSPSCTDVTIPSMRWAPTPTPQWLVPVADAKFAPSPPPQADKTATKMITKDLTMAQA